VLDDRSQLLGLGEVVDLHARIPLDQRRQILTSIAEYLVLARANGATQLTLIGTEPLRRAANGADVAAEVTAVTGIALHVINVRTEAQLTFLGVTGGLPPAEPLVVVDIGGGSTEVSVHSPGAPLALVPLPIGSARLTRGTVEHDPPTADELDRLHQAAEAAVHELPLRSWPPGERPRAIFVGGTATNLARLGRLTRAGLAEDRRTLARLTAAEVVEHFGVRPQRAVQLAAGAAVVEVLLARFGLDDPGLRVIAELVHDIDVKDGKHGRPDTPGFERVIAGIALAHPEDEVRLERASAVLDDLYQLFRRTATQVTGAKP
jgi:exopolyphosphatase/guanosine-5'-triphosphate,3'-diphosphate pyrophosphatase